MAKKKRKKAAPKAARKTAKKSKPVSAKKAAKKATKKRLKKKGASAKKARKPAARKKATAVKKTPIAAKTINPPPQAPQPPESFPHKIARAFNAVVDTLVDAEHLDHQLDPGVSREPE
jgi:hypothetical protein